MTSPRPWLAVLILGCVPTWALAAPPADAKDRVKAVGQPTALEVLPANVSLNGPRAVQQVVVTGKYADGTIRDLTPFATFTPVATDVLDAEGGFLRGKRNGNTQLTVQVGQQTAQVAVAIAKLDESRRVSFRHGDFRSDLICTPGRRSLAPSARG